MSKIDFGTHSQDYASHRPGFPASFYDWLMVVAPSSGARVLDLGTGPGTIALELAARGLVDHRVWCVVGRKPGLPSER